MAEVAWITGASAGIGRACAERLHAAGWSVVGASRRGTSSGGWTGQVVDVDSERSVAAGVHEVLSLHGRIDAVVAAAGWGVAGAVEDTPIDDAKAQFETNFWGAVRVVQAVLPSMRRQGSGRIVVISSIGGVVALPFQAFYSASKFAVEGLAEALAYEVRPFGISVTLVQPGNVQTDFTANRRTVRGSDDDAYRLATDTAVGVMERDEADGAAPDAVAAVVERVVRSRRPPMRVTVGKAGERVGVLAKRLLPHRLFVAGAKGALGVR